MACNYSSTGGGTSRVAQRERKRSLHRQRQGNMVPMNNLHALVMRCYFRCDHTMRGEGNYGITDCPFVPSVQELAGLDRSVWDTRWNGAGASGKEAFLAKQATRQEGTLRAPPTLPPPLPLSPTLAPECLAQFTWSLVLGQDYTPFQCPTRRGSR